MPNQDKDDKASSSPSNRGGNNSASQRGATVSSSKPSNSGGNNSASQRGATVSSSNSRPSSTPSRSAPASNSSSFAGGDRVGTGRSYSSARDGNTQDSPSERIGRAQPVSSSIGKGLASAYKDLSNSARSVGVSSIGGAKAPAQPSFRETENRVMGQYNAYEGALSTIQSAEARKTDPFNGIGYASPYGQTHKPDLTEMTVGEVLGWMEEVDKSKGKGYQADRTYVGPYQVGKSTLQEAVTRTGLSLDTKFSPTTQKYIAMDLIDNRARQASTEPGVVDENKFANRLAMEWAGLAMPDGRSYYAGRAGNKATVSREATEDAATGLVRSGLYADRTGLPSIGPTIPDRQTEVAAAPTVQRFSEKYLSTPSFGPTPTAKPTTPDAQPGYVDPMVVKVDKPAAAPGTKVATVDRFKETYLATPAKGPSPTARPQTEVAEVPKELTTGQKIAAGAIDIGAGLLPGVGTGLGILNAGLQLTGNQTIGQKIVSDMGPGKGLPDRPEGQDRDYGKTAEKAGTEVASVDDTEFVWPTYERFVNTYLGPTPGEKWSRA